MNKPAALALLSLSLLAVPLADVALASDVREDDRDATGARKDDAVGTLFFDVAPNVSDATAATTCSLSVPVAPVTNGQTFGFSVSYSPYVTGAWIETYTFTWGSNVAYFTENTVRQKIFFNYNFFVVGSFESTIVPTALGIKGPVNVRVDVRGPSFICSDTKTMTVI